MSNTIDTHVNIITGEYDTQDWYGEVTVDGATITPAESLRIVRHSPDGFAWGYAGSGPAQLALAILPAVGVPPEIARRHYQAFKAEHLATIQQDAPMHVEVDVHAWIAVQEGKRTPERREIDQAVSELFPAKSRRARRS